MVSHDTATAAAGSNLRATSAAGRAVPRRRQHARQGSDREEDQRHQDEGQGIVCRDAVELGRQYPRQPRRRQHAGRDASERDAQPPDEGLTARSPRAERRANRELPRPLRHGIRQRPKRVPPPQSPAPNPPRPRAAPHTIAAELTRSPGTVSRVADRTLVADRAESHGTRISRIAVVLTGRGSRKSRWAGRGSRGSRWASRDADHGKSHGTRITPITAGSLGTRIAGPLRPRSCEIREIRVP